MTKKIAVLVGSLRKESYTRKLAKALVSLAPDLDMEIMDISQLPLYNQDEDDENHPPAAWTTFRDKVRGADAVLFVTPEYNRSVPGVLKNAIDVGSRPYGKSVWDKKPGAVISNSPGAISGFGANHHLRQSLVFLNVPCMQMPEAYITGVTTLFDDKGNITVAATKDFLAKFMQSYQQWIERNAVK